MTTKTTTRYQCHVLNCDCAGAMHGRVETVIAEFDTYGGWDVMWPDGTVDWYPTPGAVKRAITRRDAQSAKAARMVVTRLEWRNVPEGFAGIQD